MDVMFEMGRVAASFVDIRACRVCLATDAKLFALHMNNLAEMFRDLTTIPVFQADGLPQYICNVCCTLLRKSAAFKAKCRNTNAFLRNTHFRKCPMTTEYISSLDTSRFKFPLAMSKILVLSLPDENSAHNNYNNIENLKTEIKNEEKTTVDDEESNSPILDDFTHYVEIDKPLKEDPLQSHGDENNSIVDDEVVIIDDDDDDEVMEIDDDDIGLGTSYKKRTKSNKRKRKYIASDYLFANKYNNVDYTDKLKNYLLISKSKTKNSNIFFFYDYVLKKYIDRTGDICTPEIDLDMWDVDNVDLNKTSYDQLPTNTDPKKDKLYNYIREKYITRNKLFNTQRKINMSKLKINIKVMDQVVAENRIIENRRINQIRKGKSEQEWDEFAKAYNFEIITMSKEEQIKEIQKKKESARYKASIYKCLNCGLGFVTESVFGNHMALHDPSQGNWECEVCHKRFNTGRRLIDHRRAHKMKFICKECNKTFYSSHLAKEHYNFHQGTVYKCPYCDKTFRRYATRVDHVSLNHGRTPCEICYQMFQGPFAVQQHKNLSHKQTFLCSSCNLHFDNQLALDRHRDASSDNACDPKMSPCAKCGEVFENEKLLVDHIENEHMMTIKKSNEVKNKQKDNSDKYKKDKIHAVRKHQKRYITYRPRGTCCPCMPRRLIKFRNTTNTKELTASHGDSVESTSVSDHDYITTQEEPERNSPSAMERNSPLTFERGELYEDIQLDLVEETVEVTSFDEQLECEDVVDQDKGETKAVAKAKCICPCTGTDRESRCPCNRNYSKVMCEICGRSFQSAAGLGYHQLVHTGEKPFQCSLCDKRFRLKFSLSIHERVHSGDRPFKCPHCDMTFTHSSNLHRHQLVHTKARPFSCDVCGKTFQQSNDRKLHIRTVHMRIPQKPRIRNKRRKIE